jgi:hypothetical protein
LKYAEGVGYYAAGVGWITLKVWADYAEGVGYFAVRVGYYAEGVG